MRLLGLLLALAPSLAAAAEGAVEGLVLDAGTGQPLPGVTVTLASSEGQKSTVSDEAGRYRLAGLAPGEYAVLLTTGTARAGRPHVTVRSEETTTLLDEIALGAELITVTERVAPAVPAEPTHDTAQRVLPYSDEAFEKDVWAVAWLLLDLDPAGKVTAAKFYRRPGYGLDEIAMREAWKLHFAPARDAAGRPIGARVMFRMEWPPLSVNQSRRTETNLMPASLRKLPCAGSGPLHLDSTFHVYRNCSPPDYALGAREAWVHRPGPL